MNILGNTRIYLLLVTFWFASACTEKPKVTRAAVTKPSPVAAAADQDTAPVNSNKETKTKAKDLDSDKPDPVDKTIPTSSKSASGSGAGSKEVSTEVSKSSADYSAISGVQPAETEFLEKAKSCAAGKSAHLCLQVASRETMLSKTAEAIKNFKIACVGQDFKLWEDQKCVFEGDPTVTNAKGCYLVAAIYAKQKDAKSEKAALKCACDKKFAPACNSSKY